VCVDNCSALPASPFQRLVSLISINQSPFLQKPIHHTFMPGGIGQLTSQGSTITNGESWVASWHILIRCSAGARPLATYPRILISTPQEFHLFNIALQS
jgi:hypothetical protein